MHASVQAALPGQWVGPFLRTHINFTLLNYGVLIALHGCYDVTMIVLNGKVCLQFISLVSITEWISFRFVVCADIVIPLPSTGRW